MRKQPLSYTKSICFNFNIAPYFPLKKTWCFFYLISGRFWINTCFDFGSPQMNNKTKRNLHICFLTKWLSHSSDRMILRKKERRRRPSCYLKSFWLLKTATRTFNFLRMFLSVKDIPNLQISLRKKFLYSHVFITYKIHPLVTTSLITLKLKFYPNFLRMTPESQKP